MPRISLRLPLLMLALVLSAALLTMRAPAPLLAVEPDEMLSDPKLELRARDISLHLRCLVCQNQSIDDSNAPLAKDLRILVRERIAKGDDNQQAINYIVDRYGEFVLLRPRFNLHTLILWLGPFLLLLGAGVYFFLNWRARPKLAAPAAQSSLSADERARLARLLNDD